MFVFVWLLIILITLIAVICRLCVSVLCGIESALQKTLSTALSPREPASPCCGQPICKDSESDWLWVHHVWYTCIPASRNYPFARLLSQTASLSHCELITTGAYLHCGQPICKDSESDWVYLTVSLSDWVYMTVSWSQLVPISTAGNQPIARIMNQTVSLSDCEFIWLWVDHNWYVSLMRATRLQGFWTRLWVYPTVSLSGCEFIWLWVYLTVSLSDCELITNGVYLYCGQPICKEILNQPDCVFITAVVYPYYRHITRLHELWTRLTVNLTAWLIATCDLCWVT